MLCVEMWLKAKNNDIIKSKPKLKKCPGLNKYFQSHFNPGHTYLNVLEEVEYILIYMRALQSMTPNVNNEPRKKGINTKNGLMIRGDMLMT